MTYFEIFTFEHLYQAHLTARKSKRHKKDVILFEVDLSANLWDLYERLNNQSYEIGGYHKFIIYEPKKREIQALSYSDRIMQHALCDHFLYPLLTSRFIYDNGACQKGKGTDFSRNRLKLFLQKYYRQHGAEGYILKLDIKQYFPSISHAVLKKKLQKVVQDREILDLLFKIIDSYHAEEGRGLPMGNQTSQLFALYYLDEVDRYCKEKLRIPYYTRYMDDIIIIHEDKHYLKNVLLCLETIVQDHLKLSFNQKTQIFPIRNGVEYLGFHFYLFDTGRVILKVKKRTKKKYKKRMKKMQEQYAAGEKSLEEIKRSLAGYYGHLSRGDTYNLRKHVCKSFLLVKHLEQTDGPQSDGMDTKEEQSCPECFTDQ